MGLPDAPLARLEEREQQLEACLERVEQLLDHPSEQLRIEQDQLSLAPLVAEARPASVQALEHAIAQRLPPVELSELMIEVDRWTHFRECFAHAGGYQAHNLKLNSYRYAAVMADGGNLGLSRLSRIATLEYHPLLWTATWYLRAETLKAAVVPVVNFQYRQPLSHCWGGGTLSSSDRQRFPVASKDDRAVPQCTGLESLRATSVLPHRAANAAQRNPFYQQTFDKRALILRDEVLLEALDELPATLVAVMILFAVVNVSILTCTWGIYTVDSRLG